MNPLIPFVTEKKIDFYSCNHFQKLIREIEAINGIKFQLKQFRSSFCQILIDKDVPLSALSVAMG